MKISVIVPIYNIEKYLPQCLDSLVNQDFSDMEIICVNDGSTDGSGKILENYANRDSRIRIITQENAGPSAARNTGIDAAKGEYLMFLDGDDFYTKNACKIAYDNITMNNSDIAVFGLIEKYGLFCKSGRVNKNIKKAFKTGNIDLWKFQTFCWNKIYKSEFINRNNIRFFVNVKGIEDGIFTLICLFKQAKYSLIDRALYVYRKNRIGSIMSNFNLIKNNVDAFKVFYNTEIYQQQSPENQLRVVEKFCSGIWTGYKRYRKKEVKNEIKIFLDFIESNYDKSDLEQFKKYRQLKSAV